ncbi:hypothetical protein THH46_04160 [Pseudomonas sp. NA13]
MGTLAFSSAAESFDQTNAPYISAEGERVLASFDPAQYPGEASPTGDLGYKAAQSLAELLAAHVGGKALSGELSSALKGGATPNLGGTADELLGGAKGIVNATSHKADDIRFSQNTVTFNKTDKDGELSLIAI